MSTEMISWVTNSKVKSSPKFAGFWIRSIAFFIDVVIGGIVGFIAAIPFESLYYSSDRGVGIFIGFFIFLIKALFQANRGQSVGQIIMKIGVASSRKRNYFDSFVRNVVALVLMAIPLMNAVNALITGVSDGKQGLHDKAAKTWIIKL
jgi:uncharacterized RDD family membrane protein YckC